MEELGAAPAKSTRNKLKWWLIVAALLVAIGYGVLGWLLKQALDDKAKLQTEKSNLQKQNDDLTKQVSQKSQSSKSDSSASESKTTTPTQSLKDNIAAAVSSKNLAALEGYMASSVNVVIAASEKAGPRTPAQAVSDMAYLNSATAPWNFALPAATLATYKAGFYGSYFAGGTYVGESTDHMVVSFGFDSSAKINVVFMAANAELLH